MRVWITIGINKETEQCIFIACSDKSFLDCQEKANKCNIDKKIITTTLFLGSDRLGEELYTFLEGTGISSKAVNHIRKNFVKELTKISK